MIEERKHIDGTWKTTEYRYKDRKILIKSQVGHGMKAHVFYPNKDEVQFTLRFHFIEPERLLQKVYNKIDNLNQ